MIAGETRSERDAVRAIIEKHLSERVRALLAGAGTQVRILGMGERFAEASPVLASFMSAGGGGVDAWPVPPAGLFVVAERTVYLRSIAPMTVVHEVGHAIDAALGGGAYLSSTDARIRRAFASARRFVTPYAASGLDEFFAEGVRAFYGVNDPLSLWPAVSRQKLRSCSPDLEAVLAEVLA